MEITDRERRILAELERRLTGGRTAPPAVSAAPPIGRDKPGRAQPPTRSVAGVAGALGLVPRGGSDR